MSKTETRMANLGQRSPRGESKHLGMQTAKKWCRTVTTYDQIAIADSAFKYGDTLDGLRENGHCVPSSQDVDFALGFYKQVRYYVSRWRATGRTP